MLIAESGRVHLHEDMSKNAFVLIIAPPKVTKMIGPLKEGGHESVLEV